ncbi:hypothetical protein DFX61_23035 [Escherichia coli]|nr:hypothetical protein [Escherichia coli]
MLSKTGFTHSDLLNWQIEYAGGSLNVNGTIMRDTYKRIALDTARTSLALECDAFNVIEEIKRISANLNLRPLAVATYVAHKSPGIRSDIAGDVITLLAQDEVLSSNET